MMKLRMLLLLITSSVLLAGESVDWILSLGGKIERDSSGNVAAVNLRGSWVNDVELMSLASLPHLEKLDLSHTRITDQGMTAIKDWKHLKGLNVRGTRISDGTLEIVSHLTQLEALDIANTPA